MKHFRVPHFHVILRQGYDVWTYPNPETGRFRKLLIERLVAAGHRPIIVTCHFPGCRIYIPDDQGQLKETQIHGRLDAVRHPQGCLQGRAG